MTPLFERWTSVRSLWEAAGRAARGKRHRASVARVMLDLEGTVLGLEQDLRTGAWRPGRPSNHSIQDPKPRTITAAPFADRIVHQALCAEIGPLLDRGLIADVYACRHGKGTHAAVERATAWARASRFALHLDVQKYFPSIDHAILVAQLTRDIPCERTLEVCKLILEAGVQDVAGGPGIAPTRFHFAGDDLFTPLGRAAGLPIGNLTSQHFANRFLSPVDHRAKDRLRVRRYLRYMDDMVLFGDDRGLLTEIGHAIEGGCNRQRLRLHPWRVSPTRDGVGCLGFRILPAEVRVKRSSVRRAKRRLRRQLDLARPHPEAMTRFVASLRAVFAHWAHADSWRLREQTLHQLGLHDHADEAP